MIKDLTPRLQEGGKIKIGKKSSESRQSKDGRTFRAPQKIDHFLITGTRRDAKDDLEVNVALMEKIAAETGQTPEALTKIPIMLLYPTIDENFRTFRACYMGRTCFCRCQDGEVAKRATGRDASQNVVYSDVPCDPYSCEYAQETNSKKPRCKWNGILQCMIPQSASVGSVFVFRTTSKNSISNIIAALKLISGLTFGQIAGVPLSLTLRPRSVEVEGKVQTIYIVNVEAEGNITQLRERALETFRETRAIQTEFCKLLPPPEIDEESEAEQQEVAEEFYPEAIDAEIPESESIAPAQPTVASKPKKQKPTDSPQASPAPTPAAQKPAAKSPIPKEFDGDEDDYNEDFEVDNEPGDDDDASAPDQPQEKRREPVGSAATSAPPAKPAAHGNGNKNKFGNLF